MKDEITEFAADVAEKGIDALAHAGEKVGDGFGAVLEVGGQIIGTLVGSVIRFLGPSD